MPILGELIKKSIHYKKNNTKKTPFQLQKKELSKLIRKAKNTEFGFHYDFRSILKSFHSYFFNNYRCEFYESFKKQVPIFDYDKMYQTWWHKTHADHSNVSWPGTIKYYALSSGTSGAASKFIPVSKQQLKAIKKTGIKQLLDLKNFNIDAASFEKHILMLGGSTDLIKVGQHLEGDLSGITISNLPIWLRNHYKPGNTIAQERDWGTKLNKIVEEAHKWDISFVVGVPAWIQILLEKIIAKYGLQNIHDIWPNLVGFCHGGVAFEPYKKSFETLLRSPIKYIETYLASEGFFAYQVEPNAQGMKLVLNGGIFYEFVPFNEENFDEEGNIKENAETLMIDEITENQEYALLISTRAGAWRYLIGDTIKFVNYMNLEIKITGRTKHFISLCGEHLSIDNMNEAIFRINAEFDISINEFTVFGFKSDNEFGHKWFLGLDENINVTELKKSLDDILKDLNDDYATERKHALKNIEIEIVPSSYFYNWLKHKGKEGAQIKFPRVLQNEQIENWESYICKYLQK